MGRRASVAMWLSILFVMLMLLIAIGGFVRLSGSGLSIPQWPIINGSLLPPFSDEGWLELQQVYVEDYQRLLTRHQSGTIGIGRLVPPPADVGTFQIMFMIEWTHRAVAAILGIIALACWLIGRRSAEVRERAGVIPGLIVGAIVFQAVLGGILVKSGTATQYLFLHLAVAAIILSMIVWSILSLIQDRLERVPEVLQQQRKGLRIVLHSCLGLTFIQLMLGALVAGSRHHGFSSEWPFMYNQLVPYGLWDTNQGMFWNIIQNYILHQWIHRWFAWLVVIGFVALLCLCKQSPVSPRLSLALRVAFTFLVLQIILGISNVFFNAESTLVALTHLLTAMFIIVALIIAMFDLKYERMPDEGNAA